MPENVLLSPRRFPRIRWTDRAGTHEAIVRKRALVGASTFADLVVDDTTVSRIHCQLDPTDAGLQVRDLASRNGVFLDGAPIRNAMVALSGELRVGRITIHLDYAGGETGSVEIWQEDRFHTLIGRSQKMRELFALLARVAPTDASILIRGETGSGKEVVARAIHDASLRAEEPYVVVDCAALPENLLDAELFGHTKGAFTGAVQARAGAIEAADGGTVFLDEIGELPVAMQPKLLRVLEQRAVRRIGETIYRPVNVRFVTATHRDLLSMVSRSEFREDLYFRLCVLPVEVPSLRDRVEDIEPLVRHFVGGRELSKEFVDDLVEHPWRGNVRELRNYVERALALGEDQVRNFHLRTVLEDESPPSSTVTSTRPVYPPPSLPSLADADDGEGEGTSRFEIDPPTSVRSRGVRSLTADVRAPELLGIELAGNFKHFRERWNELGERAYLEHMLRRFNHNVTAVAREACVDRTHVHRLVRKYGL